MTQHRLETEEERVKHIRRNNLEMFGDEDFHLCYSRIGNFSDGEVRFDLRDYKLQNGDMMSNSVREKDVVIIHSPYEPPFFSIDELVGLLTSDQFNDPEQVKKLLKDNEKRRSVNENTMELLFVASTLSQWANSITLVSPYHPYSRQDHMIGREGISARTLAELYQTAGINQCIFFDLHSKQIEGFFPRGMSENLSASPVLLEAIARDMGIHGYKRGKAKREHTQIKYSELGLSSDYVIASPDAGGTQRARYYAKVFGTDLVIGDKRRPKPNEVAEIRIIGDVAYKNVYVIDDIIDTAGTMDNFARRAKSQSARRIIFVATHALFTGSAVDRLDKLHNDEVLDKVIVTNSVYRDADYACKHKWFQVESIAPLIAKALYELTTGGSLSNVHERNYEPETVVFK